ncbi:MAG TPA: YciI family protein [Flavobacterium sp.]
MKKAIILLLAVFATATLFSQKNDATDDEKLAKTLNAAAYEMRPYVFCLLKTGSNTTATKKEMNQLFESNKTNINQLATAGKLVAAGPFMKNERNYRSIYVFNANSIEKAKTFVATDPAVQSNLLDGSAALQETLKIHDKTAKNKI